MSERASEWAQRSARAKRAVQSKQMSEQCERMSERTSKWLSTLRFDFISFLPIVRRFIRLARLTSLLDCFYKSSVPSRPFINRTIFFFARLNFLFIPLVPPLLSFNDRTLRFLPTPAFYVIPSIPYRFCSSDFRHSSFHRIIPPSHNG